MHENNSNDVQTEEDFSALHQCSSKDAKALLKKHNLTEMYCEKESKKHYRSFEVLSLFLNLVL